MGVLVKEKPKEQQREGKKSEKCLSKWTLELTSLYLLSSVFYALFVSIFPTKSIIKNIYRFKYDGIVK